MSIISTQRRFAGARHAVDLARQRQLELAAVGQAGQRIAAGQIAQPVDHRLQPLHLAQRLGVGQPRARLLQQLQRRVQAQRRSAGDRQAGGGVHGQVRPEGRMCRVSRRPGFGGVRGSLAVGRSSSTPVLGGKRRPIAALGRRLKCARCVADNTGASAIPGPRCQRRDGVGAVLSRRTHECSSSGRGATSGQCGRSHGADRVGVQLRPGRLRARAPADLPARRHQPARRQAGHGLQPPVAPAARDRPPLLRQLPAVARAGQRRRWRETSGRSSSTA